MDWMRIFEDGLRSGVGLVAAVYALTAVGLNLQFGYTGLANYGQAGFLLVGAYGTAIAVDKWDLPLWVAFLVGIAVRRRARACCSGSRRCGSAPTTSRS